MSADAPQATAAGQEWAAIIRRGASAEGVCGIIQAVNQETAAKRSNRADVIIACAQLLGQSIPPDGVETASEMRQGIMAMIDGYLMQAAVEELSR